MQRTCQGAEITMEAKTPLSVRNGPSSIPKPMSSIPKPMSRLPVSARKRPALSTQGKENAMEPAIKRPKVSSVSAVGKKAGVVKRSEPGAAARRPAVKAVATKATTSRAKPATKAPATRPATKAPASTKPATARSSKSATTTAATTAKANGKPKRNAWDLKGRLQDMEGERGEAKSHISALSTQLQQLSERLDSVTSVKVEQESTIKVKQEETNAASLRIVSLEGELRTAEAKYLDECGRFSALQRQHTSLQCSHDLLDRELLASRSALSQVMSDASTLQCRYDTTKISKDEAMAECARKSEIIAGLEATVAQHLSTIAECEEVSRKEETMRRSLHNTIQELKGNIRVFCRIRPALRGEPGSGSGSAGSTGSKGPKLDVVLPGGEKEISLEYTSDQATVTGGASSSKGYNFEFDHVFGPSSTQEGVFSEISQLVQSALDGYNVCIFAYGQTGSGKTYTMEGPGNTSQALKAGEEVDRCGMIPRAVEQVFSSAVSLKEKGWEYKLEASFLEIYNETIRDLLTHNNKEPLQHDIKLDSSYPGGVYVTNVTPVTVSSESQVARLLERAAQNRAVAATNCNERSSRSHSVFRLQLTGSNKITGENCKGSMNLVDLAGSERLAQSGSVGDRLRETKNINKSLSNLGQVIMALANKDQHIPYRNSKLTYLLQNSLGGNSKTLMFVNMSPQATSFQETLCSLRFATKVNQCNIGTARKSAK